LLSPGESQTISFTISPEDLASFDTKKSAWVAEAGTYTVMVGASSLNIKDKQSFNLPAEIVTEKVSHSLLPQVEIKELKQQ
jgi:beta-glucosidase